MPAPEDEPAAPQESDDGCDSEDLVGRAVRSEFVVWSNPYFTIMNNKHAHSGRSGVYIRIRPQYAVAGLLGPNPKSKTVTPEHYGETRDTCCETYYVLRAWMLHRMRGFAHTSATRAHIRAREVDELRSDVVNSRLHHQTVAALNRWAPEVLAREA